MSERFDVVVAGSGLAGSILARLLARAGRRVLLVERGSHPRFAVGESSTPLAAIALERLAARYGLPELASLAAYGRWSRDLPGLGRGLKRGFTFLAHRPGRAFAGDREGRRRLLVAASPNDEVADSHWLRADVDAHLVARAAAEGVEVRERTELAVEELGTGGCRLRATPAGGEPYTVGASFLVDATGAGGFLAGVVPIAESEPRLDSALLFTHFDEVPPLQSAAGGPLGPPGPYPDERAAVHHLLEEGWMYALRFDDGRVSAGVELLGEAAEAARRGAAGRDPEAALRAIVGRYPTLAAQYEAARALRPVAFVPRLQRRRVRAAGPGWLLLPHGFAFSTPLFSTGIAWSLLGVERAARLLEGGGAPGPSDLERYSRLLGFEADWVERLAAGAFSAIGARAAVPAQELDLFAPWSLLYFAAASWSEARQRLLEEESAASGAWCWEPFLGAGDRELQEAVGEAERRLREALSGADDGGFAPWMRRAIAPRDVAGLGRPDRGNLYPVDLDDLVAAHDVLGLTEEAVRGALPRLRGAPAAISSGPP